MKCPLIVARGCVQHLRQTDTVRLCVANSPQAAIMGVTIGGIYVVILQVVVNVSTIMMRFSSEHRRLVMDMRAENIVTPRVPLRHRDWGAICE